MHEVNYIAVALAALSAFLLGGLWYSPILFAKPWMAQAKIECGEDGQPKGGNMALIFGGAFVLNLLAAWAMAAFMGDMNVTVAAAHGFGIGLCWVTASLGVNYLFERRPLGLWLINSGYFVLQFTIMGAIIGAFN